MTTKNSAASKPGKSASSKSSTKSAPRKPHRLDQLQTMITRADGASIAEMVEATGWQQHSIRGALAGALKKRGLTVTSEKIDGVRRYHADAPSQ